MKETEIHIRAFNDDLTLRVKGDYDNITKCINYVRRKLGIDTVMVKKIVTNNNETINPDYRDPEVNFNKKVRLI